MKNEILILYVLEVAVLIMDNEERAEQLVKKYGFNFERISKSEIIELIETEINNFQEGSSEYIRLLCGYLYCIGDMSDAPLIKKVKYGINFDVECMIDVEWIENLEDGDVENRKDITDYFVSYYKSYFGIEKE